MLYELHDWQAAALAPARLFAMNALSVMDVLEPFMPNDAGRWTRAALNSFEHSTRQFGKPAFGLHSTMVDGQEVAVNEEIVARGPWCDLLHFRREIDRPADRTVLLVAPMSGHFATLLRGTVAGFLPDCDVYITDWHDARDVPLTAPVFDFDAYVTQVIEYFRLLGPDTHVVAVCQPAVPVLVAVSVMSVTEPDAVPATMTLIGGPIDTREAPTQVNTFAKSHDLDWFRRNVVHHVPFGRTGATRLVYPGFLQLAGFMAMNLDRHMDAHWQMFLHLADGDGESLSSKRAFYEEYRAVMDMPAEFYLQTIEAVFHEHRLPRGTMRYKGELVRPAAITRTAMLTIEGERDDISGLGQTRAAHRLTTGLPESMREHVEQPEVGHYGLFNGRRFRANVAPRIKAFMAAHSRDIAREMAA